MEKTLLKYNPERFQQLKKAIKDATVTERNMKNDKRYFSPTPQHIGLQLTHKCNLKCTHCFQWHEDGGFFWNFDKDRQKSELSIEIIEKVLKRTYNPTGYVYVWGGEPMVHTEWDKVADLLAQDSRWTVLSTNGLLIERKMESFLKMSKNLVSIISVDGLEKEFEDIRGKGTYKKLIKNLTALIEEKRKGNFHGKIHLNCVLSDGMAGKMYEFMEYFEEMGDIDTIYFTYPYFISETTAAQMDQFYKSKLSWMKDLKANSASWWSYSHHVNPEVVETIKQQISLLNARQWKTSIKIQPALRMDEIDRFIKGSEWPAQNVKHCFAGCLRVDVLADGRILTCKLFPELTMGNIYEDDILDVWKGEQFGKFREVLSEGLMPICSQCNFLYIYGK